MWAPIWGISVICCLIPAWPRPWVPPQRPAAGEWVAAVRRCVGRRLLPGGGGECPHHLHCLTFRSTSSVVHRTSTLTHLAQLSIPKILQNAVAVTFRTFRGFIESKFLFFCLGTYYHLGHWSMRQDNFDYFMYQVHLLVLFCLFICPALNNVNILNFIDI